MDPDLRLHSGPTHGCSVSQGRPGSGPSGSFILHDHLLQPAEWPEATAFILEQRSQDGKKREHLIRPQNFIQVYQKTGFKQQ